VPGRVERRGIARPSGPHNVRVCTSECQALEKRIEEKRGRPGRPLGSAPAPAGALPWRARGAEPLSLFHEKEPHRPGASEATWWRNEKSSRRSVSIAPPSGGTRNRLPSRDRSRRHPQEGQHRDGAETRRDPGPSASGEGYVIAREGSKPLAETLRGSVHMWTAPDLQG
jgi:hypothetical protein